MGPGWSIVLPKGINNLASNVISGKLNDVNDFGAEEGSPFFSDNHYLMKNVDGEIELVTPSKHNYLSSTSLTIPFCDRIGDYAFYGMIYLTDLTTTSNVKTVGNYAFAHDSAAMSLMDIHGSDFYSVGDYSFYNCGSLHYDSIISNLHLSHIGAHAFDKCHFSSVTISSSMLNIGEQAFANNSNLTDVHIDYQDSSSIASDIFDNCPHLANVYVAAKNVSPALALFDNYRDAIQSIEIHGSGSVYDSSVADYPALASVTFTDTDFTIIPSGFFEDDVCLSNVIIPDTVTSIETHAFNNTGITSIDLTNLSNVEIEDGAFNNCQELASISLNYDSTDNVGNVFTNCGAINTITIHYDGKEGDEIHIQHEYFSNLQFVENIVFVNDSDYDTIKIHFDTSCFKGCVSLRTITMPDFELASLGNYVFEDCRSLNLNQPGTVNFLTNLSSYPEGTFYGCESLSGILFTDTTSIGRYAFAGCSSLGDTGDIILTSDSLTYVGTGAFAYISPGKAIKYDHTKTSTWDSDWNLNFYGSLVDMANV